MRSGTKRRDRALEVDESPFAAHQRRLSIASGFRGAGAMPPDVPAVAFGAAGWPQYGRLA